MNPRKKQGTAVALGPCFSFLHSLVARGWYGATLLSIAACGAAPTSEEPPPAPCPQPIIHGTPALDSAYDAIGSLGQLDADGVFHATCSAALIAADFVLTAKHCTMHRNGEPLLVDDGVFFGLGPDASQPLATVRVTSIALSEPQAGGVTELGSDIAVCRLERHIEEIAPLRLAELQVSDDLIGSALTAFGYGTDEVGCAPDAAFRPIRRMATETLRAIRGNAFDAIYGSHDQYLAQALRRYDLPTAERKYAGGVLLDGYEIWAEAGPSESRSCHGDSGGPVTLTLNGAAEILGVTSWSWSSEAHACDFGAVVAVFGPETAALLRHLSGLAQ